MKDRHFTKRLREIQAKHSSVLCVGLDPDLSRLPRHLLDRFDPPDAVLAFNEALIESTHDVVAAYKLNLAFFEVLEERCWDVVRRTVAFAPDDVLTIADGKRSDIGNSARFYAEAVFGRLGFDACTVSAYMGRDSVDPFLDFAGRGVFVLVRTSNPGARDFQTLDTGGVPLFERVGRTVMTWDHDRPGSVGFVVGATDTAALRSIREFAPNVPILTPGVGAQGGNPALVMQAAGSGPVLVSSSRQIIYASPSEDFSAAARREADALRTALNHP